MERKKYIIVGGVAGGASFACRLRRLDENADIVIYEKSNFVSYANCGLPYYLSKTIANPSSLTLQTPASLKARFNIDVHVNSEVIGIDREKHLVKVKSLVDGTVKTDCYDKLILSPGAEAIKLTENAENVFELKAVEDSLRLRRYIEEKKPRKAAVIGGGFIGVEAAENLVESGLEVTLIEGKDHVLANFDLDMASFIHNELLSHKVNLLLSTKVESIERKQSNVIIHTDKGDIEAELLIQAIGVRPANQLAASCSLSTEIRGCIKTGSNFQTDDPDIFAIGDAIALDSFIDGTRMNLALAGVANKEGRELASYLGNIGKSEVRPLGTSIIKVFGLTAGAIGFTEGQLEQKGIAYDKVYLSPFNHASYYPGASLLYIKLLFGKGDYAILGAQIVGGEGVDKRIDVLSVAMRNKMKAYELKELELSYAPPFGSAKDPINMIGYMVENIKNGLVEQFYAEDILKLQKDPNCLLVDVRSEGEYALGHIEGSINIPIDELRLHLGELPKDKKICLICLSAVRSYIGCRILNQRGFKSAHLAGGYRFYKAFAGDK
ncbi:MAG: FAD-dependent oxidoreductase [Firmicutes bacterium]|uniref:FAD-dependent oxidoreductase n=1 Tax=Candidatus Alloenteromonas pullistercoris TaxID=2840785 RepID=A0A9D9DEA6_9FIRM|nr:FAD-dependent oxidoreductase [Candidatus Enteromonas pullistercoris]